MIGVEINFYFNKLKACKQFESKLKGVSLFSRLLRGLAIFENS